MAESIDQIIAGGAGSSSRADFSGIADIPKAYWDAKDQRAKNDLRDAFKGGVPTNPDGSLDIQSVMKTLFQKGDVAGGIGLAGAASGAADRAALGNIDGQPIVGPSTSRNSVSIDPSKRPDSNAPPQGAPQGQQPTVMAVLSAQGIPNDQLEAASASVARQLGVDPNAPLNLQDPQVRNVLAPAVAQLKRMGLGQVQPPQPGDNAPQGQPQQVAQAAPQAAQPVAPQDDQILKRLTLLSASPDKATAAAAQTRLKSYLAAKEPTPEMKNATASGLSLPGYQERQGELAAQQAGDTERAKSYVEKYNNINAAGDQAINEIPKLKLALKQMDDPNYYSGPFNQYNINAKRLVAALGGDPNKAAPQEIVNKITADSVLNGMGALKGLGPIRVAEMKLLSQATLSPDNSIQAQKFLASMAIRVQERVAKVSDVAQSYNDGVLDNGYDKKIRAMDRAEPLFNKSEIDRFQNIINGKEAQTGQAPNQTFASPEAARAAGKKAGDIVTDASGKQWKLR